MQLPAFHKLFGLHQCTLWPESVVWWWRAPPNFSRCGWVEGRRRCAEKTLLGFTLHAFMRKICLIYARFSGPMYWNRVKPTNLSIASSYFVGWSSSWYPSPPLYLQNPLRHLYPVSSRRHHFISSPLRFATLGVPASSFQPFKHVATHGGNRELKRSPATFSVTCLCSHIGVWTGKLGWWRRVFLREGIGAPT